MVAFTCPGFSSIFRHSSSQSNDPAVVEVANAIYHGGRMDGLAGLEAVAHVIQNRCSHDHFPSEPRSVVQLGAEQFKVPREAPAGPPAGSSAVERRLHSQARRLATQLVCPPKQLPFADPTGGALYFDTRGPASLHSISRPADSSRDGRAEAERGPPEEPDTVPDDDACGIQPPRHAAPQTSIRSFTGRHEGRPANPVVPPAANRQRQPAQSPSGAQAVAQAGSGGAGSLTPSGQAPSSAFPSRPPPTASASSSTGVPGLRPAVSGPSVRMAGRQGPGRGRLLAGLHLQRGPSDSDGFHDMILPCGLFQDEVIELMYRDLNPEDYELLNKLDERVTKKNILQRTTVDKLPRQLARDIGCSECGVCLQEVAPTARVCQLPCRHAFHPACIARWLTQCKSTCPLCSAPIDRPPAAGRPGSTAGMSSAAPHGSDQIQVCSV
eukprot:TRINITY_DN66791_c0_g1_i1.p1 TRINITY_DN66791_c0_g1~~TRINITY_DN66791_c0_g1_i1.p1  ORF type:complete len:463 (-),score=51.61 TRINITY_DN66791_c0_g1_i1:92-1405(-)